MFVATFLFAAVSYISAAMLLLWLVKATLRMCNGKFARTCHTACAAAVRSLVPASSVVIAMPRNAGYVPPV